MKVIVEFTNGDFAEVEVEKTSKIDVISGTVLEYCVKNNISTKTIKQIIV